MVSENDILGIDFLLPAGRDADTVLEVRFT